MCLSYIEHQPYNKTRKRWKVLKVSEDNKLSSIHERTPWKLNTRQQAVATRAYANSEDIGFHVVLSKADAAKLAQSYLDEGHEVVIAELEVKGFNASGYWDYYGYSLRSETWTQVKAVQVFTASGRYNITDRFTK